MTHRAVAKRKLAEQVPLYPRRNAKKNFPMELRWRHLQSVDSEARGGARGPGRIAR
jgi:hypothetical protein